MDIKRSSEGISKKEAFKLVHDPEVKKLKEVANQMFTLDKYILYSDINNKGEDVDLLAISTNEGVSFATNSSTFIRDFTDILDQLGEPGVEWNGVIKVVEDVSKNDRKFYQCSMVD